MHRLNNLIVHVEKSIYRPGELFIYYQTKEGAARQKYDIEHHLVRKHIEQWDKRHAQRIRRVAHDAQ